MPRVPDSWLIDGLFEDLTLVMPASRATEFELVPSPKGEIQFSGQRWAPVTREVVRSLGAVEHTDAGVLLRLSPVRGVLERKWAHPPLMLLVDEIALTRERGGFDDASALVVLAGDELSRREDWYVAAPLKRVAHPRGTVWLLNTNDLGLEPGGLSALVDLGKGRAFSIQHPGTIDWSRVSLVPGGHAAPPTLCDDGLPLR